MSLADNDLLAEWGDAINRSAFVAVNVHAIDDRDLPDNLVRTRIIDLVGFKGDQRDIEWRDLVSALRRAIGRPESSFADLKSAVSDVDQALLEEKLQLGREAEAAARRRRLVLLSRFWFWITQITTVIGLVSIVEDVRLWKRGVEALYQAIASISPDFAGYLLTIGRAIHAVLEVFRGFFRPLVDFLTGWLPFEVPVVFKDILIVCLLVGIGLLRTRVIYYIEFSRAHQFKDDAELMAPVGLEPELSGADLALFKSALLARHRVDSPKLELSAPQRKVDEQTWFDAVARFGEPLVRYYEKYGVYVNVKAFRLFKKRINADKVVWIIGIVAAALVALDLILSLGQLNTI